MVNQIKRRFFYLVLAVLALSAVLSVAGHVVDAAIGRGQAQSLAAQLLGGPQNNWVPRKLESNDEYKERMMRLRELVSDGRYVHTGTHIFDPLKDSALPNLGAFKLAPSFSSKRGGDYYIVQLEGDFWNPSFEERVRSTGADVIQGLPSNSMIVRASQIQMEQVASFSETRWTGSYHPAYRISPMLLALVEGENEGAFLDDKGSVRLFLSFFPRNVRLTTLPKSRPLLQTAGSRQSTKPAASVGAAWKSRSTRARCPA